MKKIFLIPIITLFLGLVSCKKENVSQTADGIAKAQDAGASTFFECDDWGVAMFIKNGTDVTNDYRQLRFLFCPDNSVNLYNDILAFSGHWYTILDKGNPTYFTLNFDFHGDMSTYWTDFLGNWKIITMDKSLIHLETDSPAKILELKKL